jgi:hypothetical protein
MHKRTCYGPVREPQSLIGKLVKAGVGAPSIVPAAGEFQDPPLTINKVNFADDEDDASQ